MSDKLTIKDETAAIDLGARDLWDNFTEDQRKQISFYLLNRYASSVRTSNREVQELAVLKTNEYFNKNYFSLTKHPKLLWHLICMCGNDEKTIFFHEWIGFKKKESNTIFQALSKLFPEIKDDELELMSKLWTDRDVKEYARNLGMLEDEIKKLV